MESNILNDLTPETANKLLGVPEPKFEAGRDTVEGYKFLYPADGDITVVPTPEEFYAEGTTPLAEITPVPFKNKFTPSAGHPAYTEYTDESLYLERKPAVIDGDRTQLTETQMGAVVEEVFDQTLTENVDFFSPAMQIGALQERVYALETFNAKLLLALKQHGFDTVKLFR